MLPSIPGVRQTAAGTAGASSVLDPVTGALQPCASPARCCCGGNVWPWAWKMLRAALLTWGRRQLVQNGFPAFVSEHTGIWHAASCHCPTPAQLPAVGQGPLCPHCPSPAPSCSSWHISQQNYGFLLVRWHQSQQALSHPVPVPKRSQAPGQTSPAPPKPCGATSTSPTEEHAPKYEGLIFLPFMLWNTQTSKQAARNNKIRESCQQLKMFCCRKEPQLWSSTNFNGMVLRVLQFKWLKAVPNSPQNSPIPAMYLPL